MLLLLLGLHSSNLAMSSSSFQVQFESQLIHEEKQPTMAAPSEFPSVSCHRHTGLKVYGKAHSFTTHEVAVMEQAKV